MKTLRRDCLKKLVIVLFTSTVLTACASPTFEDDTQQESEEMVVEETVEEAKVFIEEGPEEISIRSENSDIAKLSLVSLEYDAEEDELLEKEVLKEKEGIDEGEKVRWEVVYSEGIPSMKLKWELPEGQTGEYVIAYDGKEGMSEEEIQVFPETEEP